jgi:hypothetical protein
MQNLTGDVPTLAATGEVFPAAAAARGVEVAA